MKKLINSLTLFLLCGLAGIYMVSCTSDSKPGGEGATDATTGVAYENKLTDYLTGNPQQLNPYNRTDAASAMIIQYLFQPLVNTDHFTYELVPQLVKELAEPKVLDNGKTEMTFEIKDGAQWDNGTPITGEDVAFSLKILKLPKTDNNHLKPYLEYIEDVRIDKGNPKKFTLICKEPYMLMQSTLQNLFILPGYVYDEKGILKNYTVKQIADGGPKIEKDAKLVEAAENFNNPKFQNQIVVGSGPYNFVNWLPNQRINLERKKNWWGDKYKGTTHWFDASPEKFTYEIITDPTTAVVALKGEKIDAIYRVEPRAFVEELKKSATFKSKFNTYTPTQFLYSYIGMNMKNPKFDDVKVRRAMRYIMNNEVYDKQVFYGMAQPVTTFLHPSKKKFINQDLKVIKQDLKKAADLMAEAGWKDTNGNGILDKEIDGELVEFEVDFVYPNIAKTSEKGVLMFQEAAKKVNLKVNAVPLEFTVMLEKTKAHNFDMYYGIWSTPPTESDPKQIWHTDSYSGGSNYVGFGNEKSDKLIEDLRKELDEDKRAEIYKALQAMIDEEAPYVFMSATQNRVAVHKKFGKIQDTGVNPGYFAPGLQVLNVAKD